MRFIDFLKNKIIYIFCYLVALISIIILLNIFETHILIRFYVPIVVVLLGIVLYIHEYYTKKLFYNKLNKCLNNLDKKYLISEIIDSPNFLEGRLLYEFLYEIDKNYLENINIYKNNNIDFKDYIELWCHEIKTPIATSKMIIENNKNKVTNSINDEINKIEGFVEQVLYFARSEYLQKDYMIKETDLSIVINNIIKKNKKLLIGNKIKVELSDLDVMVNSDFKWLEFIINQIINNSIKYHSNNPLIKISTRKNKDNIILDIFDNGIGIKTSEIDNIFDKCFTGSNGRLKNNSTGIGLYLCKKLIDRLGHKIEVKSKENEYTTISIVFPINSMVNELTN